MTRPVTRKEKRNNVKKRDCEVLEFIRNIQSYKKKKQPKFIVIKLPRLNKRWLKSIQIWQVLFFSLIVMWVIWVYNGLSI